LAASEDVAVADENAVANQDAVANEDAAAVHAAAGGEVHGGDDARLVVLLEVRVAGADAAVNDGDADALAGHARKALEAGLRERRAGRLARHGQLALHGAVGRDVGNVVAGGEFGERTLRHDGGKGVERVERAGLRAALRGDRALLRGGRASLGLYDDA